MSPPRSWPGTADEPTQREKLARTVSYYWLFVCLGLDIGITGPSLPSLAAQTGAPVESLGILFLLGAGGGTLGTILSGRLLDRLFAHPIMGLAQLGAAALLASVPSVSRFWLLCGLYVCKGVCVGIFATGANTLLLWTHRRKASPYLNGLHFCFGLGAFLAPLVAAQVLAEQGGYRWAFWVLAIFMGLAGLRVLLLRGRPLPDARSSAVDRQTSEQRRIATARVRIVLVAAALYLFFYVSAEISYGGWIFTYTVAAGLASETVAAYLNSGFWLLFTIGRLVSVPAAVFFPPQRIIPVSILGCLVATALLVAANSALTILWIASLGLGFFMGPIWPSGFSLVGRMVHLTAKRSSMVLIGDTIGAMILPSLIGFAVGATSPQAMIWLVGASLFLTAAAFAVIRLTDRNRKSTDTAAAPADG